VPAWLDATAKRNISLPTVNQRPLLGHAAHSLVTILTELSHCQDKSVKLLIYFKNTNQDSMWYHLYKCEKEKQT